MDEMELHARVLAREPAAWRAFVDQYKGLIASACARVAPEHVDDLVGETYVRLLANDMRRLRSWSGAARLSTWVYKIARQAAFDLLRRQAQRRHCGVSVEVSPELRDDHPTPLEAVLTAENRAELRAAVKRLDSNKRRIVELICQSELSDQQIADRLGIDVKKVHKTRFVFIQSARAA